MTKILVTNNYTIFKTMPGNRPKVESHIRKLVKAMDEKPYLTNLHPILVNEKYEVIDGQHRLEALKRLNKPVHYIKGQDLRLEDVQMLNAFSKNWTHHDFALGYARLGKEPYVIYLDSLGTYLPLGKKLVHNVLLRYLTNRKGKGEMHDEFKRGIFEIPNEHEARLQLQMLKEVIEASKDKSLINRNFGIAFHEVFESENYNHDRMLSKISKFADKLNDCITVQDYQRGIEKVYNYFVAENEQVRLF